ncbi:Lsr2 dimerization domain-containing protein [Serinibacter arcticus]|uniref:Lsr2 dimerization domain-containing protein n=1 Tax=Serinibacter arcticus TaxID=1655435 RepID=A0A4Z1E7I5_9MICO|nr:histone-like nucleoid-structuring protein Lsr2 [Serinibacter arcticus]TGO05531.1 hypothetical protein SERN_1535 [Serinibacter arcticus]
MVRIKGVVLADDDTDGGRDDHEHVVTFGYRGAIYEVELDECDRAALAAVFERYLASARPVKGY